MIVDFDLIFNIIKKKVTCNRIVFTCFVLVLYVFGNIN